MCVCGQWIIIEIQCPIPASGWHGVSSRISNLPALQVDWVPLATNILLNFANVNLG